VLPVRATSATVPLNQFVKLHASKITLLKVKMRIAEFLIKTGSIRSSVNKKLFEPERFCQFFDQFSSELFRDLAFEDEKQLPQGAQLLSPLAAHQGERYQ
jgi:hypothetical protein